VGTGAIKLRLRNDIRLATLTLLGVIAGVGVSPFALFRLVDGQWNAFVLDMAIVSGIAAGVVYAWRTGDTRRSGIFLTYFFTVAATAACFLLGITGTYWLYPAMVTNFFRVDRRHAMAIALTILTALLATGGLHRPPLEAASFVATAMVSCLLTYVFAYQTAMQRADLETLASKDALTGICNRRALLEVLERTHRVFKRDGRACGLMILDLDHFKRVNDDHGHMAGDRMLIRFVRLLEQSARKSDLLFRYGGEEFVFLSPATTLAGLTAMAEHLRRIVEQDFAGDDIPLTVSIGGAVLRRDEAAEAWFARADTALYTAKNAGRNKVIVDAGE
jgi:diguanylate cyclase